MGIKQNRGDFEPLSPRVNYIDPIVRHDPTLKYSIIAKIGTGDSANQAVSGNNTNSQDMKRVDGMQIPVIKYNNIVLDATNIQYMNFIYDGFTPELKLIVRQNNRNLQTLETPGLANIITVVMTPQVDGAYKDISTDFYITDIKYKDDLIIVQARYQLVSIEQPHTGMKVFNSPGHMHGDGCPCPIVGCTSPKCQLPPNEHPTTYEFLHVLAEEIGLGYATTDMVKEISDDKYRILHGQSYKEVIQQHTAFGGLDKDSIFDSWIDLYRYLVVVNLSWVMNDSINPLTFNDIGIHPTLGIEPNYNDEKDIEGPLQHRIITNQKDLPAKNNIRYTNWEWVVNNKRIIKEGSVINHTIFHPQGFGDGKNSLDSTDIMIVEQSRDGKADVDLYGYAKSHFTGFEYENEDNNAPILMQEQLHDSFLKKLRNRRLKIEMETLNLGLQRGTVIALLHYVYDRDQKLNIYNNSNNEAGSPEDVRSKHVTEMIDNESLGFLDPSMSGFFYIDGMNFEYDAKTQKIHQYLYLIKRGQTRTNLGKNDYT